MEVEAYTRESIEYDRPPQKVRGTLTTRWVAPLNYLQHLVNGVPVDADTVRHINDEVPEAVDNAFCPTGEGGGIDPSCSPHGGGADSKDYAKRQESVSAYVSGTATPEQKVEVSSIAKASSTTRSALIRIARSDPKWSTGSVIDLSDPTSFTGSKDTVLSGKSVGDIGWKSTDKALISIESPTKGIDVDYSKVASKGFSASGENETIVSGEYRVERVVRETEPGTNPNYGYTVPHYILREVHPRRTTNANPEGCNQYTGPGCGTGSQSEHHDSAMSLIDTHLAAAGLSKETADHYQGSASAVIRNMSPLSAQRLSENTMSVKFFSDNSSLSKILAGRYEFVAKLLQGGASVGGCYDGKLGQLLLDGSHVLGGKPLPTPGVYAHEFGHAIDGPKGARISDDPDWHSAWSAELKTGIISKYAGTSPSEGFAEFARLLHGTNLTVEQIEKHVPKCVAVWRSYGLLDNMPRHKMTANKSDIIENAEPLLDELFSEGVDVDGVIVDMLLPNTDTENA